MQTIRARSAGLIGKAGGRPVGEFLLVRFGRVAVDRALSGGDFTFTRAHALAAVQWFDRQRRKLVIDYEHQTLDQLNRRPDGLAPAAGWVGRLEVRADGLWAAGVEWTERAHTLLARGEHVYFSPVIYWTDKDCTDLAGLGPVALTNDPAMAGAQRLAAKKGSERMIATVFQARPLNGASDGGESAIAAIVEACREALGGLMAEAQAPGYSPRTITIFNVGTMFNTPNKLVRNAHWGLGTEVNAGNTVRSKNGY